MDEKIKRKLIKKDAKMLLVQEFRSILFVSLPLMIIEFFMQMMNTVNFLQYTMKQWVLFVVLVIFALPCIMCQSSYLLKKIMDKKGEFSAAFSWLYSPKKWWAIAKIVVWYLGVFLIYIGVMIGLYFGLFAAAKAFSNFIHNPSFLEYYHQLFLLIAYIGFMVVEVFTTPAINLLAEDPDQKTRYVFLKAFRIAAQNFQKLFVFKLTFLALVLGVAILQMAGIANIVTLEHNWIFNLLYVLIGLIMYFAGFYLKIYMNTSMLSYVSLYTKE